VDRVGRETGAGVPKCIQPPDARSRGLVDLELARLAERQHGVVSLTQFIALGLSASAARKRAAAGRLHRVHRGVYAVGHARLDVRGRRMAAVFAGGPGAVLSHRTAADALGLLPYARAGIDVTIPLRSPRAVRGITIHRSPGLRAEDRAERDGIPCTSPARTLLDLADLVPPRRLVQGIEAAERLGLYDGRAVAEVIDRAAGRPAARRLSSVLAAYEEPAPTKTELERCALHVFEQAGLARPLVNSLIATADGPLEVDFCWPDRRLVVEADSFEWHRSRARFEDDRRRDQLLGRAGWSTVRITWRQLCDRPDDVIAAVVASARSGSRRCA
jgi:predicted transcriptional regulator of viral defense system